MTVTRHGGSDECSHSLSDTVVRPRRCLRCLGETGFGQRVHIVCIWVSNVGVLETEGYVHTLRGSPKEGAPDVAKTRDALREGSALQRAYGAETVGEDGHCAPYGLS